MISRHVRAVSFYKLITGVGSDMNLKIALLYNYNTPEKDSRTVVLTSFINS